MLQFLVILNHGPFSAVEKSKRFIVEEEYTSALFNNASKRILRHLESLDDSIAESMNEIAFVPSWCDDAFDVYWLSGDGEVVKKELIGQIGEFWTA